MVDKIALEKILDPRLVKYMTLFMESQFSHGFAQIMRSKRKLVDL